MNEDAKVWKPPLFRVVTAEITRVFISNDRVSMFTQFLRRGKHSFRYKLKAKSQVSFQPYARIEAMYSQNYAATPTKSN